MSTHKANKEKRDFFLANVIYIPYLYHSFLWLATSCRSCSWFTPWMPFTSRDLISQQFFAQSRVQSGYLSWVGFGGCSTNRYDVGCGVFIQSKLCVICKVLFDHEMYFTRSMESGVVQKNISCTKKVFFFWLCKSCFHKSCIYYLYPYFICHYTCVNIAFFKIYIILCKNSTTI